MGHHVCWFLGGLSDIPLLMVLFFGVLIELTVNQCQVWGFSPTMMKQPGQILINHVLNSYRSDQAPNYIWDKIGLVVSRLNIYVVIMEATIHTANVPLSKLI